MCNHSYLAVIYKSENPTQPILRQVGKRKSKGVVGSLKQGDELTILASCLSDCLSGLDRDGVFSSYNLLLEEREKNSKVSEANLQYACLWSLLMSLCLHMNVLA